MPDKNAVRILPFLTTFTQNFLRGWLLILGLKEGLEKCATVCVKSEVILRLVYNHSKCRTGPESLTNVLTSIRRRSIYPPLCLLRGNSITTWIRWGRKGGKGGGGVQKMSIFVHAQGIRIVHVGGGGQIKAKFYPRSCWMPPKVQLFVIQCIFSCGVLNFRNQKLVRYLHKCQHPVQWVAWLMLWWFTMIF